MSKRPYDGGRHASGPPPKRHQSGQRYSNNSHPQFSSNSYQASREDQEASRLAKIPTDYAAALKLLPVAQLNVPSVATSASSAEVTFTNNIPNLPPISDALARAPFSHKSSTAYSRAGGTDLSYERLEFIGDAYLELYATRLIAARYSHLPSGQMSQLRELLVKNETLSHYALLYGFDDRIDMAEKQVMLDNLHNKGKGNKGFTKVLGDVFEAYVAAVVMSDLNGQGSQTAESWLTALWSVKLVEQHARDRTLLRAPLPSSHPARGENGSSANAAGRADVYDPNAKADIIRRLKTCKLEFAKARDHIELKGAQLGQSKHFIALYLTGCGYEKQLLAESEGKSKLEAGNWAALEAMYGKRKAIFEECEAAMTLAVIERAEKAKRDADGLAEGEVGGTAEGQAVRREIGNGDGIKVELEGLPVEPEGKIKLEEDEVKSKKKRKKDTEDQPDEDEVKPKKKKKEKKPENHGLVNTEV